MNTWAELTCLPGVRPDEAVDERSAALLAGLHSLLQVSDVEPDLATPDGPTQSR